jgi:hypothetical protein
MMTVFLKASLAASLMALALAGYAPALTPSPAGDPHVYEALLHAPATAPGEENEPIIYVGEDRTSLSSYTDGWHDGRLRPAIGVQSYQVVRANRTHPEYADNMGWTYLHAPNLAYWNGKLYFHYLTTPHGEHLPPGVTMLASSEDGKSWSKPQVLFPIYMWAEYGRPDAITHDVVMHQRMGFHVAPDGRLLALGFYGVNDGHGIGRVVREVYENGSFGPIYFIRLNDNWREDVLYPMYTSSPDAGFVKACESILNDPVRRLQWWEEDRFAKDAREFYRVPPVDGVNQPAQAFCFYTRPDGVIVGLFKSRLATLSRDGGHTWSDLTEVPSFTYGGAKIWAQQTDDGRYAAVYNPTDSMARQPLAVAVSEDGIHYTNLAYVHGEVPLKRYWGVEKRPGPQYVRGIVPGNGNPPGDDLWVVYSVSKEDMWISRVPVPIRHTIEGPVDDDFDDMVAGGVVTDWNIYHATWCPVEVVNGPEPTGKSLRLKDQDPIDYAKATRVIGPAPSHSVHFRVWIESTAAPLDIELTSGRGARHVQLRIDTEAKLVLRGGDKDHGLQTMQAGRWYAVGIDVDSEARTFGVSVDGRSLVKGRRYAEEGEEFDDENAPSERILFRTGDYRMTRDLAECKSGSEQEPGFDEQGVDEPVEEAVYYVDALRTVHD